ncbi:orotidine-5'-phosphate decarboxylase [Spiroplasma litorale]|uniref:Orotidine 5'-phosphate decarboxylase n=1 Tax=Spiroplasma litorale TaxID=216942 RepID=A0A0K1W2Q9_9MOLU|nr:orotidine-5'-phosphate decarboxylase [Spiroplasma litorale]AKX34372.1 orotidine-5'-phosphate decarboxylase [Spiroplasma litorale]
MINKIIIALDFSNFYEVKKFLNKFKKEKLFVKVGMELFYKYGNKIIRFLKKKKYNIFIDLKMHDIPNTVYKAAKNILLYKPDIITIHASGGLEMIKYASNARNEISPNTKIFAVTYLTSLNDEILKNELKINKNFNEAVIDLSKITEMGGADGVVCSVWESKLIKNTSNRLITLTPGIRSESSTNDQKRVASIKEAIENKSDYIVVGREITTSNEPYVKYLQLKKEWENE